MIKNTFKLFCLVLLFSFDELTALDTTTLYLEPGQTHTFFTEDSRIHSKFDVKSYELDLEGYHSESRKAVELIPTYALKINTHAFPGTFKVVGKNDKGETKTTTIVIVGPKKNKRNNTITQREDLP